MKIKILLKENVEEYGIAKKWLKPELGSDRLGEYFVSVTLVNPNAESEGLFFKEGLSKRKAEFIINLFRKELAREKDILSLSELEDLWYEIVG